MYIYISLIVLAQIFGSTFQGMIHFVLLTVAITIPLARRCGVHVADLELGLTFADVLFGPLELDEPWFSSIALSFPASLLIVLAYMAARSYVHHLVRPWFAPLDRIRVLADGLVQGTSHAYH